MAKTAINGRLRGNAVVGQSGGPTAAINATLAGVIRGYFDNRAADGVIGKLYGMRNGIEGLLAENIVDLGARFSDGNGAPDEKEISKLEHTPASGLGSCRKKLPDPATEEGQKTFDRLLEIFRKNDIRYFFYIGGNDSMDTVAKLSAYMKDKSYEMRLIGVPKTVDNDLVVTDHTPGFGSAAKYIAVSIQEMIRDCAVYTVPAVTVVEIMGRDSGWLTAAAAIGRVVNGISPDLVYLPERNFDTAEFIRDLRRAQERHPNVVVAVSEGIHFADGRYVCEGESTSTDVFGHKQLSGTAAVLADIAKRELKCKTRSVELNLPQRCAAHLASAQDLLESVAVGRGAVAAALDGVSCEMMTILRTADEKGEYAFEIGHSDVAAIANKAKVVNDEFINAEGNDVTDECCRYLLPLIRGEAAPEYINGIPDFFVL